MTEGNTPVFLLMWLNKGDDKRELCEALSTFAHDKDISYAEVQSKASAEVEIAKWLSGNPMAQFLYVGTHGNETGIGPSADNVLSWGELLTVLKGAPRSIVLWLGACRSSHAAQAWSPICHGYNPIAYIVSFDKDISSEETKDVLQQLLQMTGLNPIVFVDKELPQLRTAVRNTSVQMYYPAYTVDRRNEFVFVDDFDKKVGVTFDVFIRR